MLTRGRVLGGLLLVALVAGGWSAWVAWQVRGDLVDARLAADRLQAAAREGDMETREAAAGALGESAESAASTTDGVTWDVLTRLPVVGDDAAGVRALSSSLDLVSRDAVAPLGDVLDRLDRVAGGGRVDVRAVDELRGPVTAARDAMSTAHRSVATVDSDGFVKALRGPFDDYVATVADVRGALETGTLATEVLPAMLGAGEPRSYFVVFQNNAEIRATGGLPGSWALMTADRGQLDMVAQGTAHDFPPRDRPITVLDRAEQQVFGTQLGTHFQDANFTSDFTRSGELWGSWWDTTHPDQPIDGVITLDPVAMSYLLEGTGPIRVGGRALTAGNLVEELLSRPYQELEPTEQDRLFAEVARVFLGATSRDLASPLEFVRGFARATEEGRFRLYPRNAAEAAILDGTRVLGEMSGDDGATPHVDIGLNDATGSKMSYYLRYDGDVKAVACRDGVQELAGTLRLRQEISPKAARALPDSVTGSGRFGTERGAQLVLVRVHAPYGGRFGQITLDGRRVDRDAEIVELDGRPVATLVALLSSTEEQVFEWTMESGPGQTGAGELELTPSVVPGANRHAFGSAC